jgi:Ran-binding protein 1
MARAASAPDVVPSSPAITQAASPTPIFGASSTFGGTGFGGFAAQAAAADSGDAAAPPAAAAGGDDEEEAGEGEEECKAEFKPVVQLDEVEISTGEEEEEALFDA